MRSGAVTKDFVKEILGTIKKTPNTQDGIKNLVLSLDKLLDEVDNDITGLVSQRQTLVNLFRQCADLYKLISGEDLLSPEEIADKESLRKVPRVEWITSQLQQTGLTLPTLPWRNTNSVTGVLPWVSGILGGLCGVMGIFTAVGVAPSFLVEPAWATWIFWFGLGVFLFIACIATLVARGGYT